MNCRLASAAASLLALCAAPAAAQVAPDAEPVSQARDRAAAIDIFAWNFIEGITTEVGPRLAGTEAEARGREWAVRWLNDNGFANVREEPFAMTAWVRGPETARVIAPFPLSVVRTFGADRGAD